VAKYCFDNNIAWFIKVRKKKEKLHLMDERLFIGLLGKKFSATIVSADHGVNRIWITFISYRLITHIPMATKALLFC
jgi:hypothetical protein